MGVEVRTAAELIALDVEGRGPARRAARETAVMRGVLAAFVERPGAVAVDALLTAIPGEAPERVREALAQLDRDDLIRLDGGRVDLAYPFSAAPTPFVVELGGRRGSRYVCCAIDALGIAAMLDEPVGIRSECHHCRAPIALEVDPSGPGPGARDAMVWAARQADADRRACDTL